MCGIVGIAGKQDRSWLTRMNALHAHRGPDGAGEYRDEFARVAMAARRLSILDLEKGNQPMTLGACIGNAQRAGMLWIVHNGEIYNSPEIRRALIVKGHRFQTNNSDTEMLLHLYEEKQEAMLGDLNGMFAFVIHDKKRNLLFGARDRIGIKPLYYLSQPNLFAFASESKSLLALPSLRREIDPRSLFNYMSLLYVPGTSSILEDVQRIPPGHWFKFHLDSQELKIEKYWDIDVHTVEQHSVNEWCELIRAELRQAIKRWTLSDVPIACSLSGGIDSSALVGLLGELGYSPIKTYSLGFAGPGEEEWSELTLARQVADQWDTEHHELVLHPDELLRDLVKMVWHLDEPYGGGLPSWYIFECMSRDVKVGLTGSGGDELFGNYGKFIRFERNPLARLVRANNRLFGSRGGATAILWEPLVRRARSAARWLNGTSQRRLVDLETIFRDPLRYFFFDSAYYFPDCVKRETVFQRAMDPAFNTWSELRTLYEQAAPSDVRSGIAYVDFKTQLTEEFLLMTDRFSMAHSLEARVPYLDHQLVELVFRIPPSVRTHPTELKYLLKRAIGDLLPPDLLNARKRGFVLPIKVWLRNQLRPLAEQLLAPARLARQGIFRADIYDRFVNPHLEGKADYTWQIWAALMFQLWHLVFIEQAAQAPSYRVQDIVVD